MNRLIVIDIEYNQLEVLKDIYSSKHTRDEWLGFTFQ